ncbi:MAG: hypothetical protein JJU28_00660 [Cyclobacteriaceae bacterium]|nr:hypothetical protein [Cyclobacteriaceae bacterium]
MLQQKIPFYKIRGFGLKMNATIDFIRQNVKSLFLSLSLVAAPVAVVVVIFAILIFKGFTGVGLESLQPGSEVFFILLGGSYLGIILISLLIFALIYSVVFSLMDFYDAQYPNTFLSGEIVNGSFNSFLSIFVLLLLGSLLTIAGFVLLIIPGIYILITLTIAPAVLHFEKKNVLQAIKRSFELIRNNWWSTFALLIVTSILQSVVAALFMIPFYVVYFIFMVTVITAQEQGSDIMDHTGTLLAMAIGLGFFIYGSYLTRAITITGMTFQYFHLVEKKESKGLISEIESL